MQSMKQMRLWSLALSSDEAAEEPLSITQHLLSPRTGRASSLLSIYIIFDPGSSDSKD
jgi:hypothetical protein